MGHEGENRIISVIRRTYAWPGMRRDVARYVRNCHTCKRAKAPRDKKHGLLKPLSVPRRSWKHKAMDFVVELPESKECDAILQVIDRKTKKRHYIPCKSDEEGTSAEETAKLFLKEI